MLQCFILKINLKSRMILLYLLLNVLVIAFTSYFFYTSTIGLLRSNQKSILEDSLDYLNNHARIRLNAISQNFINIFQETEFKRLYIENGKMQPDILYYPWLANSYGDYFTNIVNKNSDIIESIMLVTNNSRVFAESYSPSYSYPDFLGSQYYKKSMENFNKLIYVNNSEKDKNFAILRSFYYLEGNNPETLQPGFGERSKNEYNVLAFLLKKSYFENQISQVTEKRRAMVIILDENSDIVLKSGTIQWEEEFDYKNIIQEKALRGRGSYEFKNKKYKLIVNYDELKNTNWHIVMIYNEKILLNDAVKIFKNVQVIIVMSLLFTIIIAIFVSNTVVKPIRKLVKLMGKAADSELDVRYETRYNDEVAYLGNAFNKMVGQIRVMIRRIQNEEQAKRKKELQALQAQINPHFLYNTLDTVYWMAKADKKDNIANLIADLADFYRLSLNKGEDITTVQREIDHVRKYLDIQRVRNSGRFQYRIDVDRKLLAERVPKLILQPLVENSIIHGFNGIEYEGFINISVCKDGSVITFTVEDNGKGIDGNILEELNSTQDNKTGRHGYALRNVNERIKLYAGSKFGLTINGRPGSGTTVTILFPLYFESKGEDKG